MTIFEFLGAIYRNERIPTRVTVRGLDILLLSSVDQNEMTSFVRDMLRSGQGKGLIRPTTFVQFVVKGKIMKDTHTRIKIRNDYIDLEALFSAEISRLAPDWIHAVR